MDGVPETPRLSMTFPDQMAAQMLARAAASEGPQQEYYLWLATEWERAAKRHHPKRSAKEPREAVVQPVRAP